MTRQYKMKHENRIMSDENTDHIGIDSDGYGEWMKSGMRYYRRNRVADLIVMILHGSRFYEDGVGFRRFDFEDFVEELNRHGIYYRGEHFEEVMYEVVNRKMLRDKFNDYLKRKLWIADNTRNML